MVQKSGGSVLTIRLKLGQLIPSLILQVVPGRVHGALREVYAASDALVVGVGHFVRICGSETCARRREADLVLDTVFVSVDHVVGIGDWGGSEGLGFGLVGLDLGLCFRLFCFGLLFWIHDGLMWKLSGRLKVVGNREGWDSNLRG